MRFLLFPLAFLYGIVVTARNAMFDLGILPVRSFSKPIISVGNLNAGGSGKTPYVEYLIRLLSPEYRIATLSRGYKRNTRGFVLAGNNHSTPDILGDESAQMASKFQQISVAVDERRVHGIEMLSKIEKAPDLVILDDAFQHRYVKAGLSVLVTDFHLPYYNDYLLPVGRLRELRRERRRADIIIISKSPEHLNPLERKLMEEKIKSLPHQKVFFSYIRYGELTPLIDAKPLSAIKKTDSILCFCGIGNPLPLEEYLQLRCTNLTMLPYKDHHPYSSADIKRIISNFHALGADDKLIVTTEKDAMRLRSPELSQLLSGLPAYYLPIETDFSPKDKHSHDQIIRDYVRQTHKHA